jgi:hypothetical protein
VEDPTTQNNVGSKSRESKESSKQACESREQTMRNNYVALLWMDEQAEKSGIPNRLSAGTKEEAMRLATTLDSCKYSWLEVRDGDHITVQRIVREGYV